MAASSQDNAGWIHQWIAQQRALLEKTPTESVNQQKSQSSESGSGTDPESSGYESFGGGAGPWADLNKTYVEGLLRLCRNAANAVGAEGTEDVAGGELLESWRTAWSNSLAHAVAPAGWSDLLSRTPPLGLFREQAEAWRAVAAAQADVERLQRELGGVLRRVQIDAFELLEKKAQARTDDKSPVQSLRELFDLWVECSEQVFSGVAHSSAYAHLQGELGNAAMRLRAKVQKVIEHNLKQFDLPTRSELNSVHLQLRGLKQRIANLERQVAGTVADPTMTVPKQRRAPAKRNPVKSLRPRKRS